VRTLTNLLQVRDPIYALRPTSPCSRATSHNEVIVDEIVAAVGAKLDADAQSG